MGRVLTSEDLRNWFSKSHPEGGWKRINSKGEAIGPCAREPGEPKPKCMSNEKRAMLSKGKRASAVRTKRKHDPNPERKGEPIMVSNFGKGKISEESESRRELNAYRALEMARDRSIPTETIFKTTGGYRQSVVDARNTPTEKKTKKSTKKKPINEENEPTNKELWSKIQSLVSGKVASIEYNGKTIEGPNNGKGFRVHPSAYSNGWASAKYKELGGDWKTVKEGRYNFNGFVDREQILSEMKTFGEVVGRTAAVVVEKYIVQDNLKSGVGADELRSYAKKFGAKTKSQKETTEFMFDDENAADSFMKAITGKSLAEANECEGRQAGKPWRTPGEKKKFAVCVDNKIVRFGDPGLSIKRDQPGRLKNFRARHGCDKGGIARDTPKYWSCQMWRKDKSVTDLTQGE
jgi:hypothetical protein